MEKLFAFLNRYLVPITLVLWITEVVFLASWLGIKQGPDSFFFLSFAEKAHFGDPYVDDHYFWYSSYTLVLSIFKHSPLGLYGMVAFQVILATSALFPLYNLTKSVSSHSLAPKLAIFLYVIWIKSHVWHFFIYTDSLFTSCSIWCLWFVRRPRSFLSILYFLPFLLFTCFLRPTGILWVPLSLFLLLYHLKKWPWTYGITLVCASLLFFFLLTQILPTFEILQSYKKGEIVYSYPAWNIPIPSSLSFEATGENSILDIFLFILHNPWFFSKITILKAVAFLGHVKPFYSSLHNVLIVSILFPIYYWFSVGLPYWEDHRSKLISLYWVLANVLLVSLTAEDWDGRFLLPILPFLFIGASLGLVHLCRK